MKFFIQPNWSWRDWSVSLGALIGRSYPSAILELEDEIRRLTGANYVRALNFGRSAIQLALEAADLPAGSEVILCTFSCSGVIIPVLQAGLEPVLADVDADFNLDLRSVKNAYAEKTGAIILPHLGGKFAKETQEILEFARERDLFIVEDAAQAFGLEVNGRWAGSFGDVGIYSFHGGKSLVCPAGGMLITDDDALIRKLRAMNILPEESAVSNRRLRRFIWKKVLQPLSFVALLIKTFLGFNRMAKAELKDYEFKLRRISSVDAQLALNQLKNWRLVQNKAIDNAHRYFAALENTPRALQLPSREQSVHLKFMVSTGGDGDQAARLRRRLLKRGYQTEALYTPLHKRKPFAQFKTGKLEQIDRLWPGAFSLPNHTRITERDILNIADIIQKEKNVR